MTMPNDTNKKKALAAFAFLLIAAQGARAGSLSGMADDWREARRDGKTEIQVDIDNDSLLLRNLDGFYTSGVRLTVGAMRHRDDALATAGWRIGQDLYTPSDIKLPPERVGPPDHPYAGWLYGGVFHRIDRRDGFHSLVGLDLGCLGPCAAGEWTQSHLHRVINQPQPQGWSRQIHNEVGAVLYAEIAPVRWRPAPWLDATPVVHGRFGNIFTDAGAGLTVRAGRLNDLPEEPTLHVFARVDARAVGYDATLQGGYFSDDSPHTVAPRRRVGEAEAGVEWRAAPFMARLSVVRRSGEIRDLSAAAGSESFARLSFAYALP